MAIIIILKSISILKFMNGDPVVFGVVINGLDVTF